MSISIIHASIDERGKISDGSIGDQTGKEVCVRTWYNKSWDYYIECTDAELGNMAATLFEKVANSNKCGYDQSNRLSFYNALVACDGDISKMKKCETDCSAAIAGIYKFLGLNISQSCTTRNIRSALVTTGKFKVYSDTAHTRSDKYAKRGGIYLKEGSHVVMARDNGSAYVGVSTSNAVVSTSTNKKGIVITKSSSLNIRILPDKNSTKVGTLKKGTTVDIIGESGNWYKIQNGYVSKDYISLVGNTTYGTVTAKSGLRIRKEKSTNSKILGSIPCGKKIEILDRNEDWYKVSYNNIVGYSSSTYIKV